MRAFTTASTRFLAASRIIADRMPCRTRSNDTLSSRAISLSVFPEAANQSTATSNGRRSPSCLIAAKPQPSSDICPAMDTRMACRRPHSHMTHTAGGFSEESVTYIRLTPMLTCTLGGTNPRPSVRDRLVDVPTLVDGEDNGMPAEATSDSRTTAFT